MERLLWRNLQPLQQNVARQARDQRLLLECLTHQEDMLQHLVADMQPLGAVPRVARAP